MIYIGTIPLRRLVYRVMDLPPSMKPLVYDFGRLEYNTEREYVIKIVQNFCPGDLSTYMVDKLVNVLAWCQSFMKKKEVYIIIHYI